MDRSDTECPDCGMPAGGVKCPKCGTLNHRSFCSACNEPLTRAAQKAIQKALADPKVQQAAEMCSRLAELEAELEAKIKENGRAPDMERDDMDDDDNLGEDEELDIRLLDLDEDEE